jgi:hypothetical protein
MGGEAGSDAHDGRLATVVSVRFSDEEHERVRGLAARQGLSVSAYIRRAVLGRDQDPVTLISHRSSNAPANSSAVGSYDPAGGIVVETTGGPQALSLHYTAPH